MCVGKFQVNIYIAIATDHASSTIVKDSTATNPPQENNHKAKRLTAIRNHELKL